MPRFPAGLKDSGGLGFGGKSSAVPEFVALERAISRKEPHATKCGMYVLGPTHSTQASNM